MFVVPTFICDDKFGIGVGNLCKFPTNCLTFAPQGRGNIWRYILPAMYSVPELNIVDNFETSLYWVHHWCHWVCMVVVVVLDLRHSLCMLSFPCHKCPADYVCLF